MSDTAAPSENSAASGSGGPRAKKARSTESNPPDSAFKTDGFRGGSLKGVLTLHIDDIERFIDDDEPAESATINLSGIDWRITAEIVDNYLAVNVKASHPSAASWHCKADFVMREPDDERCAFKNGIVIFTENSSTWGYNKWASVDQLRSDYERYSESELKLSCEITTFNCYVVDGAFGCRTRMHDVTFAFGPRYLYANKGFLAANAECFEAMFFGDFADKNKEEVVLKKVKADDFSQFLLALAPGPVPISEENVMALLRLADRFQAHELAERCRNAMLKEHWDISFVRKVQIADELLMDHFRDTLIDTARTYELIEAAKLENEKKFSKLTWIKLFMKYVEVMKDY